MTVLFFIIMITFVLQGISNHELQKWIKFLLDLHHDCMDKISSSNN